MNKIQSIFINLVNKIENNDTPVKRYIFLFFAILVLRLALEFFSSQRLFTFYDVMHIGLWFIFIVMAFLLQLHLFSGENINKLIKLVVTCFTIALTAPIIDIIVSGGHGAKMNYLSINSIKDILFSYVTIGGASLTRGATLGIRIEIVLLVIACFNYVYTKRGSVVRGIISGLIIYTVLFLSGTIPFLLGLIVHAFHLQYQQDDQSTLLLLLTLDIFLLFIIVLRKFPEKLRTTVKNAPWLFSILPIGLFCFGAMKALELYPFNWSPNPTNIFWFPLLAVIYVCFMMYISNVSERDEERNRSFSFRNGIFLILLVVSALISSKTFFSVSLLWGLLFMMYEAPLRLKEIPLLSSLIKGLLLVSSALIGFMTFGAPMIGFPTAAILGILFVGFFLFETHRFIFHRKK